MKILLIIPLIAIVFSIKLWKDHRNEVMKDMDTIESGEAINPNGFVPVFMPSGAHRNTVWILAPKNCPSDAAERASMLGYKLKEQGIAYVISSDGAIYSPTQSKEAMKMMSQTSDVINGEIPAVFINGMGRANPSIDSVLAEYRRAQEI